jgi:hypothetical protein
VQKVLVELSLSVGTDTGLQVGDVLTGRDTAVTGRILRKSGAKLDVIELTPAGEYTNFAVGEIVDGSVSSDHAIILAAALKLTKTSNAPYYNPGVAAVTHTLAAASASTKKAYLNVDTCKSVKITNTTTGADTATISIFAESESNTPALGTIAKNGDPVELDIPPQGISMILVVFDAKGDATVEEFTKTVDELEALETTPDTTLDVVESVATRAESLAKRAESQGVLDNSRADLGIAGASIARLAESQGTLDNSIADRAQSLGRRAQSVGLVAESQGLLDNSRADLGIAGASIARLAESQGTLDNSIADLGVVGASIARIGNSKAVRALSLART